MKLWRMLAALCMVVAMVFTFVACGTAQTPTTEPATEATETTETTGEEEPLVDPETFKAFIGTWYADGSSASYRIIIKEDATWAFTNAAGDTVFSGSLMVSEDNVAVTLYDPDGVQAMDTKLEEAGKMYIEIYLESLMDTLSTNYFLNQITNDNADSSPITEGDVEHILETEEAASTPAEEIIPEAEEPVA